MEHLKGEGKLVDKDLSLENHYDCLPVMLPRTSLFSPLLFYFFGWEREFFFFYDYRITDGMLDNNLKVSPMDALRNLCKKQLLSYLLTDCIIIIKGGPHVSQFLVPTPKPR